jgi:hypothetical protein
MLELSGNTIRIGPDRSTGMCLPSALVASSIWELRTSATLKSTSPAARVSSSTTWGDEAFGPAAWGASSCLPPQAATASAITSATTTSRMLRPTASPSGASI